MKTSDEVIETLRKVLNLAHGMNATQGEVEAAMARAKEIAMRYNIDLATVQIGQKDKSAFSIETDKTQVKIRSQHPQKYHDWIARTLMRCFDIHVIYLGRKGAAGIVFIGEKTDVAICVELFPWLEDVFYSTYYRGRKAGLYPISAASKNGVYAGLYYGIVEANKRMEEQIKRENPNAYALVVRSKEQAVQARVSNEFPKLETPKKQRETQMNHRAYMHGKEKGRSIKLNQLAGAQNPTSRLSM
jgi:hypothetical protein